MKPTKFTTKRSRISQIDPDDQPPFPRGFRGVHSSKTLSNYTPTQQNQETACMKQKRVRFAGIDDNIYQEVPSAPVERTANKKCADPKTSEFAFFKKLKETSGQATNTHLQGKSQSKKLKSDDCFKEKFTAVKHRHEDPSSSSLTLNVTPDNSFSFMQRDYISNNSEVDIHRPLTVLGDMHNLQAEGYGNPSRHGDQHKHGLIFSEKRQKLRRWVAETSLPEIDELRSKGYDFVSLLLSRLLPESDKDKSLNCFESGHSQTEIDFKFNPDNPVKKLHRIPENNFVDTKFWPPTSSSPTYLLEIPSDKELPKSSNHSSRSHDSNSDDRIHELGFKVGDRATRISCNDSDSSFGFCAERDKSFASACLNELDEVPYPDEYSHGREPEKFILGWDFHRMADEKKSSITPEISCRSHDTYSDNRIHELGCKVGEPFGFCAERHKSFVSTYPIELDRVWYPDDYSHGREPRKFLLGWDFDRMPDEKKSSITPEIFTRSHDIYFDNRVHELDCKVSERATPISCANSDSPFGFCAERHKYFAPTFLNELDEEYPDDCSHGRESQKFLLGWDFDKIADEEKSSTTTQALAIYPIACRDEEQLNLDCGSHMHDPCEPYLLAHHDWNRTSIWCSPSGSSYNSPGHFLEVKGDACDVLNGFSLPVINTENNLNQFIYSYGETTKGSSFLLSPSKHLLFMSKVLIEEPCFPATKTVISSELDFNQGRTCVAANASSRENYFPTHYALEFPLTEGVYSSTGKGYGNFPDDSREGRITSHLHQGMFNIHDWPSYYFEASIKKEKAFPLLLDNSHWNKTESKTYSDSDEKRYF